jgi:hypothetical protein
MTETYTGGCACGTIRYELRAEPMMTNDCHCRQCQRESGTGHGSYLAFPRAAAKVQGEAKTWDLVGDNGTVKRRAFCPTCGLPVYLTFPGMPDVFVVRAGTLDDPGRYKPQMAFWTAAAQAWDHIDPALQKFDKMPPK